MTPAVLSRPAFRDLDGAVRWIAGDNPVAAKGLVDAVLKAAERIGEHPMFGPLRPDLTENPRFRFVALTGYPYLIAYVADREPPLIVRMLHTARDLPPLLRNLR